MKLCTQKISSQTVQFDLRRYHIERMQIRKKRKAKKKERSVWKRCLQGPNGYVESISEAGGTKMSFFHEKFHVESNEKLKQVYKKKST